MVAALQAVVISYGLQKHYQTWTRTWVVVKSIFNFVKSKIGIKERKVEEKKEKDVELKTVKSSLKRFGQIL